MSLKNSKRHFFSRLAFFRSATVDLPLHQDLSARFVPWMVGMMLYVALLFGMVSVLLFQGVHRQLEHDTPHLTLEIPAPGAQREGALTQTVRILQAMEEVERLRVVSPEEVKQTFTDFFDESLATAGEEHYEPLLVDVWVHGYSLTTAQQVAEKMRRAQPEVQVLVHQTWTQPLVAWVAWMKWGFLGIAALLLLGILMVVAFAVRTGVSIHQPVLEILDLMGASGNYITRQFQLQNRKNTLKSLGIALFFLLLSLLGLAFFLENSGSLYLLVSSPVLKMYALVMPLFMGNAALLMWGMTQWVVGRALERSFLC